MSTGSKNKKHAQKSTPKSIVSDKVSNYGNDPFLLKRQKSLKSFLKSMVSPKNCY